LDLLPIILTVPITTHTQPQARAAEAELLGLLEQEEAEAGGHKQGGGGGGGKMQKDKKGRGRGRGKGRGKGDGSGAQPKEKEQEQEQGADAGEDGAAAALAAVSLADDGGGEAPLSEEGAFILARAREEAPDFVCPLSDRIMQTVALASDGFSYERVAIEAHIERCRAGACRRVWECLECGLTCGIAPNHIYHSPQPFRCTCMHSLRTHAYSRPHARLPQDGRADRPDAAAQPEPAQPHPDFRRGAAPGLPP
jgi:hypothetical protein